MKKINTEEARNINGGWVPTVAKGSALLRLMYEHSRYGRCYTRYYGFDIHCPVCGKYTK